MSKFSDFRLNLFLAYFTNELAAYIGVKIKPSELRIYGEKTFLPPIVASDLLYRSL